MSETASSALGGLRVVHQFYVYSDPNRDPRQHTLSVVFIATATGEPEAADDAKNVAMFEPWRLPQNLCFDHDQILTGEGVWGSDKSRAVARLSASG